MSGTTGVAYKSPLHEMTQSTPTCLWNDSASIQELTYSIEHSAVGATCNPVIVLGVLKKEMSLWKERIYGLIAESPTAGEDGIAWQLVREISIKGAALLKPIFDTQRGKNGRLSIQTDPRLYRDTRAIVAQASEFSQLAPNMIVKIPVVKAGISSARVSVGSFSIARCARTIPESPMTNSNHGIVRKSARRWLPGQGRCTSKEVVDIDGIPE